MPRGGARPNSGRPKGRKDFMTEIVADVRTAQRDVQLLLSELAGTPDDPGLLALELAKNPNTDDRLKAVIFLGLTPYVYPKLSAGVMQYQHINADDSELSERFRSMVEARRAKLIEGQAIEPEPERPLSLADLGLDGEPEGVGK